MKRRRAIAPLLPLALLAAIAAISFASQPARSQASAPSAVDDASSALPLGSAAPLEDVAMKGVDGHETSIGRAAGKRGTLVLFICDHCPWVKAWQTRIAALGNAAPAQGIGVIAINSNDPDVFPEDAYAPMRERAKQVGYKFPYVVDATSDVARAFGATHTPEAFLFDASGRLVYHGAVDDNAHDEPAVKEHWLADAIAAVSGGKPVATAKTKSLGCGIRPRAKRSS